MRHSRSRAWIRARLRVTPARTTRTTASARTARVCVSETASKGAVSITILSNCCFHCRNCPSMRLEESISAGLGGRGPVGRTCRVGNSGSGAGKSRYDPGCVSTVDRPKLWFGIPNTRYRLPLRRSASTSRTRSSLCARTMARFRAVVVLPSSGNELVMTMTRGGLSIEESNKALRMLR